MMFYFPCVALSDIISSIKDKTGNIYGGLVVDRDVANPHKTDFYLQSHPGLKGSKCLSFLYRGFVNFLSQQQVGRATT